MTDEENKNTCEHVGHWAAGGMVPINAPNNAGLFLAQVIFCTECGFNQVKLHSIVAQQPQGQGPAIAKP